MDMMQTTRQINFRVADPNSKSGKSYRTYPAGTEVYGTRTSAGWIVRLPGNSGSAVTDSGAVRGL